MTVTNMTTDRAVAVDTSLPARAGACAAMLGAATIHATVIGEHYAVWAVAGVFFLGLQLAQTLLAVTLVTAWSRWVAQVVVVTNVGILAVWALSRTVGIPVGPLALRARESLGRADLACMALEIAAVLALLPWAWRGTARHQEAAPPRIVAAVAVAAVLLTALVTGWGLEPALSGEGQHHGSDAGHSLGSG